MAGTAVACLYGYERLCWTNKAREKSLKQQVDKKCVCVPVCVDFCLFLLVCVVCS